MLRTIAFAALTIMSANIFALTATEKTTLLKLISPALGGKKPDLIKESPIAGLYTVMFGPSVFYLSKDGRYVFEQTSLLDLKTNRDLTEDLLSVGRKKILDTMKDSDMVVYTPKKTKHVITVFTDIDCPYCQKFHDERNDLLAAGIKIRYMLYPRSGVDTDSYHAAVAVMCSNDRQDAMTKAKAIAAHNSRIYVSSKSTGVEPKYLPQVKAADCENPVKQHMKSLHDLGLEVATPQILLANGELVRGYVPAPKLIEMLAKQAKK